MYLLLYKYNELLLLQVNYAGGYTPFSVLRFGQRFVNEVANPTTILNFFKRRGGTSNLGSKVIRLL